MVLPLVLALFVGSAVSVVSVHAAVPGVVISTSQMIYKVEGSQSVIGPLKTETLNEEELSFIREWIDNPDRAFAYIDDTLVSGVVKPSLGLIYICLLDEAPARSFASGDHFQAVDASGKNISIPFRQIAFYGNPTDSKSGEPYRSSSTSVLKASFFNVFSDTLVWSTAFEKYDRNHLSNTYPYVWSVVQKNSPIGVHFTHIPPAEKPNPPASSEPAPPTVSYPDFPTIGSTDNKYVPYDTTAWNIFSEFIKGRIGAAVNIGLLVLAVIMGIFLVIRVVKMFIKK